ncbi:MAG: hypothetical protein IPL08_11400 [Saprospiraceae bacterium]|nr:hypothetical protein [Saprospiraceae bacterium]
MHHIRHKCDSTSASYSTHLWRKGNLEIGPLFPQTFSRFIHWVNKGNSNRYDTLSPTSSEGMDDRFPVRACISPDDFSSGPITAR